MDYPKRNRSNHQITEVVIARGLDCEPNPLFYKKDLNPQNKPARKKIKTLQTKPCMVTSANHTASTRVQSHHQAKQDKKVSEYVLALTVASKLIAIT